MTARWTYSETPALEQWPTITARKVPFADIRRYLPEGTASVTPEQRRAQIHIRQRHVQKRYRVF